MYIYFRVFIIYIYTLPGTRPGQVPGYTISVIWKADLSPQLHALTSRLKIGAPRPPLSSQVSPAAPAAPDVVGQSDSEPTTAMMCPYVSLQYPNYRPCCVPLPR